MSASKHTPEPWKFDQEIITGADGFPIADMSPGDAMTADESDANAARIVACVNACEGIANFPDGGLKSLMLETTIAWAEVKQQRDELAAALRDFVDNYYNSGGDEQSCARAGRAALAKLDGAS